MPAAPPVPGPLHVTFFVSGQGRLFRRAVAAQADLGVVVDRCVLDAGAADLGAWCADRGIGTIRLDADRAAARAALEAVTPRDDREVAVLTFDRVIPPATVAAWGRRMVNVHPALLPAFAGVDAIERAARGGTRFSGATIHEVTDEVDGGPVIAQFVTPVAPGATPDALGAAIYAGLEPMLLQVLAWFAEERVGVGDDGGRVVTGARYDAVPWCPALEREW